MPNETIRVLLAASDARAHEKLRELLASRGYDVLHATEDPSDVPRLALEVRPDLVLLGSQISAETEMQVARELFDAQPDIPVALLTNGTGFDVPASELDRAPVLTVLHLPSPAGVLDAQIRLAVRCARAAQSARDAVAIARAKLEERKIIERAKGLLMQRTGSSEQEAYRILQRTSQDRSVSMVEIARAVLESEPGKPA